MTSSEQGPKSRPRALTIAIAVVAVMVVFVVGTQKESLPPQPPHEPPVKQEASTPGEALEQPQKTSSPIETPTLERRVEEPEEVAEEEPEPRVLRAEIRGRVMSSMARFPGAEVVVRDQDARAVHQALVLDDGSFSVRIDALEPLYLAIEHSSEALSPVVELAQLVTSVAREDDSEWPIVDIGALEVGAPIGVHLRMVAASSGEVVAPAYFWLLPVAQYRGLRGRSFARPSGLGSRDLLPQFLGADLNGEGLRLPLPEWVIGMQVMALSKELGATVTIGASGSLVDGQTITVPAEPMRVLNVEVLCAQEPVVGAQLVLMGSQTWSQNMLEFDFERDLDLSFRLHSISDEEGRAKLTCLPGNPSEWRLLVGHKQYVGTNLTLDTIESEHVVIELHERWVASGQRFRFVDSSGHPIAGVECTLDGEGLTEGRDGWFTLERGRSLRSSPRNLGARAPGRVYRRITLGQANWLEKEYELEEAGTFEVRVTDQDGIPVEGARLSLHTNTGVISDESGRAVFEGVPRAGKRYLRIEAPDPVMGWKFPNRVLNPSLTSIPPGQMSADIVLVRETREQVSFQFAAKDLETGAVESIQRLQFSTFDENGQRLRSPRELHLGIEHAFVQQAVVGKYVGWVQTVSGKKGVVAFELTSEGSEVICEVSQGREIDGRVTLGAEFDPNHFKVLASVSGMPPGEHSPDRRVWPPTVGASADSTGHFSLKGLLAGTYSLEVIRPASSATPVIVDTTASPSTIEVPWAP